MLRAIGADHTLDYTNEHLSDLDKTYDVILDIAPKTSFSRSLKALKSTGRLLLANPKLSSIIRGRWTSVTSRKQVLSTFAGSKPEDLVALRELVEAGNIRAVLDKSFPLERAAEAHAYVDTGRRRGTVVLTVGHAEA